MKILEASYAKVLQQLTAETLKQLYNVDPSSEEIEPVIGIAQVNLGGGVMMTIKLEVSVVTPANSPAQSEADQSAD